MFIMTNDDFLAMLNAIQQEVESKNPSADPFVILDYPEDQGIIKKLVRVKIEDGHILIYNKKCRPFLYDYESLVEYGDMIRLSKLKKKIKKYKDLPIWIDTEYEPTDVVTCWCDDDEEDNTHDDPKFIVIVTDPVMIKKLYEFNKK